MDPCVKETFHPRIKKQGGGGDFSQKVKQKVWCNGAVSNVSTREAEPGLHTRMHTKEKEK